MEYKINLDQNDLMQLNEALAPLPFNRVAPLMQKIGVQVQAQNIELAEADLKAAAEAHKLSQWEHAARTMLEPELYIMLAKHLGQDLEYDEQSDDFYEQDK